MVRQKYVDSSRGAWHATFPTLIDMSFSVLEFLLNAPLRLSSLTAERCQTRISHFALMKYARGMEL